MHSESSLAHLRSEFVTQIQQALELRDWRQLEHWAKQWIQLEPRQPNGFKWLARASLAQNQIARAAYSYGRVLDFEPDSKEAKDFFTRNPSALQNQPQTITQSVKSTILQSAKKPSATDPILKPDQNKKLSDLEIKLAESYFNFSLFAQAAAAYKRAFDWDKNKDSALGYARSLKHSQQGQEAIKFLREQLYFFSDWTEGRLLLGRVLFECGQRSDAQREWQLVLEQDPNNKQALNFLRVLMSTSK